MTQVKKWEMQRIYQLLVRTLDAGNGCLLPHRWPVNFPLQHPHALQPLLRFRSQVALNLQTASTDPPVPRHSSLVQVQLEWKRLCHHPHWSNDKHYCLWCLLARITAADPLPSINTPQHHQIEHCSSRTVLFCQNSKKVRHHLPSLQKPHGERRLREIHPYHRLQFNRQSICLQPRG
jgi:hypothetical protein